MTQVMLKNLTPLSISRFLSPSLLLAKNSLLALSSILNDLKYFWSHVVRFYLPLLTLSCCRADFVILLTTSNCTNNYTDNQNNLKDKCCNVACTQHVCFVVFLSWVIEHEVGLNQFDVNKRRLYVKILYGFVAILCKIWSELIVVILHALNWTANAKKDADW